MLFGLLGFLSIIAIWYGVSFIAGNYIIPFPHQTLIDVFGMLSDPFIWAQVALTLSRTVAGFLMAWVLGTVSGLLFGLNKRSEDYFKPFVLFFQGVPPLLWVIPLILILGIGFFAPVTVIALVCFPLIAVNTSEGMKTIPRDLDQMLRVFGRGLRPRLKELILPHLSPFFKSSLKLGIVLGLKTSVVGEFFGANDGIGFQIQAAYQTMRIRRLFGWGVILVLLIVLFEFVLARWQARTGKKRKTMPLPVPVPLPGPESANAGASPILFQSVSFTYPGTVKPVFESLELKAGKGEIAVISGDSGTGKTTLLKAAAGLLSPGKGGVSIPPKVSFLFQESRLLPWRTAGYNVALPLLYDGMPREKALSFAGYLIAEVGLRGWEAAYPDGLSGGMRRRMELARCFAREPGAILLDEPFTGLQKEARTALWEKFLLFWDRIRCPVLIATHYPEELPAMDCMSFYVLQGSPAALKKLRGT